MFSIRSENIKNTYIFDLIWELSDPDSNVATMFKAQKGSKGIVKIVHVTSVVQQ